MAAARPLEERQKDFDLNEIERQVIQADGANQESVEKGLLPVRAPAQANEPASTPLLTPLDLETPQIPLSSVDNKTSARYSGGQGTESNKKEPIGGNAPADGAQTARKPPPAPKPAPKSTAQKPTKPNMNLSLVQELSSLVE